MFVHRRTFRFADVTLAVTTDCPVVTETEAVACHPVLPEGTRIDWCSRDTVKIRCNAGARFSVSLSFQPNVDDGWEAGLETGEALDAVGFDCPEGHVASVGMRDPDWLAATYDLRLLEANSDACNLLATYEAATDTDVSLQIAMAETSGPLCEGEDVSPWYAVDLALDF